MTKIEAFTEIVEGSQVYDSIEDDVSSCVWCHALEYEPHKERCDLFKFARAFGLELIDRHDNHKMHEPRYLIKER